MLMYEEAEAGGSLRSKTARVTKRDPVSKTKQLKANVHWVRSYIRRHLLFLTLNQSYLENYFHILPFKNLTFVPEILMKCIIKSNQW